MACVTNTADVTHKETLNLICSPKQGLYHIRSVWGTWSWKTNTVCLNIYREVSSHQCGQIMDTKLGGYLLQQVHYFLCCDTFECIMGSFTGHTCKSDAILYHSIVSKSYEKIKTNNELILQIRTPYTAKACYIVAYSSVQLTSIVVKKIKIKTH